MVGSGRRGWRVRARRGGGQRGEARGGCSATPLRPGLLSPLLAPRPRGPRPARRSPDTGTRRAQPHSPPEGGAALGPKKPCFRAPLAARRRTRPPSTPALGAPASPAPAAPGGPADAPPSGGATRRAGAPRDVWARAFGWRGGEKGAAHAPPLPNPGLADSLGRQNIPIALTWASAPRNATPSCRPGSPQGPSSCMGSKNNTPDACPTSINDKLWSLLISLAPAPLTPH